MSLQLTDNPGQHALYPFRRPWHKINESLNVSDGHSYTKVFGHSNLSQAPIDTGWFALLISLSSCAIILNTLVLLSFLSKKVKPSASEALIFNLVSAVLMQSSSKLFVITLYSGKVVYSHSEIVCKSIMFFHMLSYDAITWSDLILCINRFVALCVPQYYRIFKKRATVAAFLTVAWSAAFASAILPIFDFRGSYKQIPPANMCAFAIFGKAALLSGVVSLLAPVSITAILYLIAVVHLLRKRWKGHLIDQEVIKTVTEHGSELAHYHASKLKRCHRMFITILVMFCCYTVCILPMPLVQSTMAEYFLTHTWLQLLMRTLTQMAHILIPIILLSMNREYRHRIRDLLWTVICR
ncbi:uncharacterized protein LOC129591978 [Paramacrobiotus metropolitanus]|uniref:uncharacterized protein LOC129591978 n=1 Tax=Paramacrobiotus metropolitanus TaxID=2943436 RepID=UPI0024458130|nr:uncharacterized protein LOC129591978 [Paramacrobiotus metropolitanus]XP_055343863.1 uncharacterized protein LOC129591978 [Paramacrobiotus metropolitanus]